MVEEKFDGYISKIQLPNGKIYKLKCEIVEIHPMTCIKCGGPNMVQENVHIVELIMQQIFLLQRYKK